MLSFQCQINGGIRIARNDRAILIGQNDVKIDVFLGLGMSEEKTVNVVFMWYNCL